MKKKNKSFDTVKFMREQREELSKKLSKKSNEEILVFFSKQNSQNTVRPSL